MGNHTQDIRITLSQVIMEEISDLNCLSYRKSYILLTLSHVIKLEIFLLSLVIISFKLFLVVMKELSDYLRLSKHCFKEYSVIEKMKISLLQYLDVISSLIGYNLCST